MSGIFHSLKFAVEMPTASVKQYPRRHYLRFNDSEPDMNRRSCNWT